MSSEDEQAIFDETAAFAETWNRGDAQAAAAFYTEDGTRWLILEAHPKFFPPPA